MTAAPTFATKAAILKEIEALEQVIHRADFAGRVAEANLAEARRDDLLEVVHGLRADQLADVELWYV